MNDWNYEKQVWPYELRCSSCSTPVGIAPMAVGWESLFIYCPRCRDIKRVDAVLTGPNRQSIPLKGSS